MSVVFGILGLNGVPVVTEDLIRMQKSYSNIPADGSFLWQKDGVGFGFIQRYHTPESPHEVFPQCSRCGRNTFVTHARLDNRDELLRFFEIPSDQHSVTSDSALLVNAYECWGDTFVEHLYGDWITAVWNNARRRLLIALGPTANCSLFYTTQNSFFAFSSTTQGLRKLPWITLMPDLDTLRYLFSGIMDQIKEHSFLKGINALPPSHILIVEKGKVDVRGYWFPEQVRQLRLQDDREYLEAFREKYRRAVACRLRSYGGIGATLSGGLDSGSIVALAAENLRPQGRSLPVFSAVPRYDIQGCVPAGYCGDETPYVLATAEKVGNVEVNFLRSEVTTPVGGIKALTDAAEAPIINASNCFWMYDLLLSVQQQDLRVLLTGQCGNFTVSWSGSRYLWDYLDTSSLDLAFQSLTRRLQGLGVGQSVKLILKSLLPSPALRTIMHLRGQTLPVAAFLGHTSLRREFLASHRLGDHIHRLDSLLLQGSQKMRHKWIDVSFSLAGGLWYQFGVAYGIDVRDPTMDKELVEFLLSIPEDQYKRGNEKRRLIRQGMENLLPDNVRYPTERGLQGADIVYRLRDSADDVFEILNILEQSHISREVIDLETMRRVAVRTREECSPELTMLCGAVLCRGLSAGLFLKRYV